MAHNEADDKVDPAESRPDQQPADTPETPEGSSENGASTAAEDSVEATIAQLGEELEQAQDRALRNQAELENYRKRVTRQMEEDRRYAGIALMRDILPVWDNMGRALEAAEKSHDPSSLLEGLKLMSQQLVDALARHNCLRIEAVDQPFDPNRHEAITQQPSADVPPNTILLETQAGFLLHDRVVRPSQVIVSTKPPETTDLSEAEDA